MIEYKEITHETKQQIVTFINEQWGSPEMISRGKIHRVDQLPGIIAFEEDNIVGFITFHIEHGDCEVVSLDSLQESQGIGSRLVENLVRNAREQNCRRIWLITSNDNLHAMRFYQKRGFNIVGVHVNVISEARKIQPEIPEIGNYDIPIRHEIEFELDL